MRLPRFRLRTLMIAVAIAGLLFGAVIERASRFRRLARYHLEHMGTLVHYPDDPEGKNPSITGPDGERLSYNRHKWHRELGWKYAAASKRPWLPVPPDPPEPE